LFLLSARCSLAAAGFKEEPAPLTNAAQIRALSPEEAQSRLPVKLSGVVTACKPSQTVFIQDDTGGTFIKFTGHPFTQAAPGDLVDVEGVSYEGRYVPGIDAFDVRVTGHGDLPAPVPVTYDDLLTDRWHYQRVETTGIVHSSKLMSEPDRLVLVVAVGARKLEVQVISSNLDVLSNIVDGTLLIRGLAAGYINDRRQMLAPELLVNRAEDLTLLTQPSADPFAIPLCALTGLMNFNPEGFAGHRVRVRGGVTCQQPGQAIYISASGRGLMIQSRQEGLVQPGEIIEAAGFPAVGSFSAFLDDAVFRVVGKTAPPEPRTIMPTDELFSTNDGNLIALNAQLLESFRSADESIFVLRAGNSALRARLQGPPLPLRAGSKVHLTGICRAQDFSPLNFAFTVNPRAIELQLRSASDIQMLDSPSWWTAPRLAVIAFMLLALTAAAYVWIILLRKRVAVQSAVIRHKLQREAALEERHRLAREIHDSLAQSFSGLAFQLDALQTGLPVEAAQSRKQLDTARQMIRHGQESFRSSLMNLRAQELERGGLDVALPEMARQITAGADIDLRCEVCRTRKGLV
jgi:hypothetical protein